MFNNFAEHSSVLNGFDQNIPQELVHSPAAKRFCTETGPSQPSWVQPQIQSEPCHLQEMHCVSPTVPPLQYQMFHPGPATVTQHGFPFQFDGFPHQMHSHFVNPHFQGFPQGFSPPPPFFFNPPFVHPGFAVPNGFNGFPTERIPNQPNLVQSTTVLEAVDDTRKRKAVEIPIPQVDFVSHGESSPSTISPEQVQNVVVAKDVEESETPEAVQIPIAQVDYVSPNWSKRYLVLLALLNAKDNSGTINSITDFLKANFPYFETKSQLNKQTLRKYLEDSKIYENNKNGRREVTYRLIDRDAARTEIHKQLEKPLDFTVGMRFPGMFNDLINGTLSTVEVIKEQSNVETDKEIVDEVTKENEPIITYDIDMLCFPEEFFAEEAQKSLSTIETLVLQPACEDIATLPEDKQDTDDDDLEDNFFATGTFDSYSKWLLCADSSQFGTFN